MKNPNEVSSNIRFIVNLLASQKAVVSHTDQRELGISNSNLYTHPPEIYNIETQIDVFFWKVPPFKYGHAYFSVSMLNFKGL